MSDTTQEFLAQLNRPCMSFDHPAPLTAVFHNDAGQLFFSKIQPFKFTDQTHTVSEIPPPSAAELLAMLQKMTAEPPGELAERIDMGKDALAELRRQIPVAPSSLPVPPVFCGIRIELSATLDDDQWVAYDRHGVPLAVGRIDSIKTLIWKQSDV